MGKPGKSQISKPIYSVFLVNLTKLIVSVQCSWTLCLCIIMKNIIHCTLFTYTSLSTSTHEGEMVLKYLIITYGKHEGGVLH